MLSKEQIEKKIDDYLHFEGIGISSSQKSDLIEYLLRFKDDEDELYHEMVCEIRTLNGDWKISPLGLIFLCGFEPTKCEIFFFCFDNE